MTFKYLTATRLPLTGIALGLLLPINVSLAASSATAQLDWSQFQIQTLLGSVSISSSNSRTDSSSDIYDYANGVSTANDYQVASDWSTSLSTSAADALASAASSADANSLHAQAQSGYQDRSANGFSQRSGNYNLSGSGIVEISVPYLLFALSDANDPADSGIASSYAQLNVQFNNGSYSDSASRPASLYDNFFEQDQETSRNGVLSLIFRIDGDASLNFNSYASAYVTGSAAVPASVPVPGAAWLMGSVLLGFLSMTRRER